MGAADNRNALYVSLYALALAKRRLFIHGKAELEKKTGFKTLDLIKAFGVNHTYPSLELPRGGGGKKFQSGVESVI